jgi:hypothetical protein
MPSKTFPDHYFPLHIIGEQWAMLLAPKVTKYEMRMLCISAREEEHGSIKFGKINSTNRCNFNL